MSPSRRGTLLARRVFHGALLRNRPTAWPVRACLIAWLASLTGISLAAGKSAPQTSPRPAPEPLVRIDHMPLAVRDLDGAVRTYQRLGFTLKPGRLHVDGIRNMHVKFTNGAGIELITAAAPKDDLTRHYVALLAQGEGPAFVGFYTPSLTVLEKRLDQSGVSYKLDGNMLLFADPSLGWPFVFDTPNLAPDEKPEYFRHRNTAEATLGIWIASANETQMLRVFKAFGARIERRTVFVPDPEVAEVASMAEGGEVIFLPAKRQILPGRPIVGIVVQTRDLAAVNREIRSAGISPAAIRNTSTYRSLFVGPQNTDGVWLEFRQQVSIQPQ